MNSQVHQLRPDHLIAKVSPWCDITAFGASPTASGAVNRAAIQAALYAGAGALVFGPAGVFEVDDTLLVPNDTRFMGPQESIGFTLKATGAFPILQSQSPSGVTQAIDLSYMRLWGNSVATDAVILGSTGNFSDRMRINQVQVVGCDSGISIYNSVYGQISNCYIEGNNVASTKGLAFLETNTQEMLCTNIIPRAFGVNVYSNGCITMIGCTNFIWSTDTNTTQMLKLEGAHNCLFVGCWWENLLTATVSNDVLIVDKAGWVGVPINFKFQNCRWVGTNTKSTRVQLGDTGASLTGIYKTVFEDCYFSNHNSDGAAYDFNFANCGMTSLIRTFRGTGYIGTEQDIPKITGTSTGQSMLLSETGIHLNTALTSSSTYLCPILATGAGAVADTIISSLQSLGLVRQS
jgi:hypothetical protein